MQFCNNQKCYVHFTHPIDMDQNANVTMPMRMNVFELHPIHRNVCFLYALCGATGKNSNQNRNYFRNHVAIESIVNRYNKDGLQTKQFNGLHLESDRYHTYITDAIIWC